jgi:hypothetical protein
MDLARHATASRALFARFLRFPDFLGVMANVVHGFQRLDIETGIGRDFEAIATVVRSLTAR